MRHLLWPLALIFMLISWLRNLFYDWRLLPARQVDSSVLCIGNITTGGTGKTPWVQKLTQFFLQQNRRVTILSRGYSGDFDGVVRVTPDMDARKCGDEPLWLCRNTGAPVYVSRSRWQAAQKALEQVDADLFILDDGFQHRKLKRNVDVVLLDASAPAYHYWPLPVGRLREGFFALRRAQVVLINKCNYASKTQLQALTTKCQRWVKEDRLFYSDFVFSHWEPLVDALDWDLVKDKVSMACGVGNPKAFLQTLRQQGIEPIKEFIFPDHYFWKPGDIERMTYNMKVNGSNNLMITEKDAVKLQRYKKHFAEMNIQLWVCKMKVSLQGDERLFFQKLEELLD